MNRKNCDRNSSPNAKPMMTRTLLSQAILGASMSLSAMGTWAACPGTVSGNITTPCTMTGSDSVTINTGSSIAVNAQTAIYVSSSLLTGQSITNRGTISATNDGDAYGIYVNNGMYGSNITNGDSHSNALISATASGTGSQTAYGIYVSSDMSHSTISNAGTITAYANSSTSDAEAYGIYIDDTLSHTSSIVNSGTINATATAAAGNASAYGIYVSSSMQTHSQVVNNGTINATATAGAGNATAAGIFIYSTIDTGSSVTNVGTINVTATATGGDASAAGIFMYYSLNSGSSINNTGTINVTATASDSASAYGIYITDDYVTQSTITNSGTINVSASGVNHAEAHGIYPYYEVYDHSTIANTESGSINATAVSSAGDASAYGIQISSYLYSGSSIINAGKISVSATGATSAQAYGIYLDSSIYDSSAVHNTGTITSYAHANSGQAYAYGVYDDSELYSNSSIVNDGVISATAVGTTAAYAYGIYVDSSVYNTSTLANNGTITATATASNGNAAAYGIYASSVQSDSTLSNTGNITAVASASSSAVAYGVYVDTINSTFQNDGTISAQASGGTTSEAYAVYAGGGSGDFLNNGTLNGALYWDAANVINNGTISNDTTIDNFVQGDYTQGANGTFYMGVTDAADFGQLTVNGTADFSANNTVGINVTQQANLVDGDVLGNVFSAGTLQIDPSITVADNSVLWHFTAVDDGANHIDITANRDSLSAYLNAQNLDFASNLGNFLDNLYDNTNTSDPTLGALKMAMNSMGNESDTRKLLTQLGPILGGESADITLSTLDTVSELVDARLAGQRGLASGSAMQDKGLWVQPVYSKANQDTLSNGAPGFDGDTTGILMGLDGQLNDNTSVGVGFAVTQSEVDGDFNQNLEGNGFEVAAYGQQDLANNTYVKVKGFLGRTENDSKRHIDFAGKTAKGNFDTVFARVGAGYGIVNKLNEKLSVGYEGNLNYSYVAEQGYHESGAGALNLDVDSNNSDALVLGADTRVAYGPMSAHVGLGYDLLGSEDSVSASFDGGNSFHVGSDDPNDVIIHAGVGYQAMKTDAMQINISYDLEKRGDYDDQMLSAKFRWAL